MKFDTLYAEMMSGIGGVWGSGASVDQPPTITNTDFYATGDARVPKVLGAKKKGKKKRTPVMFRRNLVVGN